MNKWSLFACLAGVLAMGAGCTSSVEDVRCEVRPAALQFDRAGGTESIEVDASVAWQYEMEASAETWLTVTAEAERLLVTAAENPAGDRQTTLRIISGTEVLPVRQVVIAQQGVKPELVIGKRKATFSWKASETCVIAVEAVGGVSSWRVEVPAEAQQWLSVEQQVGFFVLSTTADNEQTMRTATVRVTSSDETVEPVAIEVRQQGAQEAEPQVHLRTVNLLAEGGTALAMTSDRKWNGWSFRDEQNRVVEPDWLTVSESRDDAGQWCLSVTAAANEAAAARRVMLGVSFAVQDHYVDMNMSITQAGAGEGE